MTKSDHRPPPTTAHHPPPPLTPSLFLFCAPFGGDLRAFFLFFFLVSLTITTHRRCLHRAVHRNSRESKRAAEKNSLHRHSGDAIESNSACTARLDCRYLLAQLALSKTHLRKSQPFQADRAHSTIRPVRPRTGRCIALPPYSTTLLYSILLYSTLLTCSSCHIAVPCVDSDNSPHLQPRVLYSAHSMCPSYMA